ncbi:glycosyl transferase [Glycomyces sp. NPDC048151]|uniref:glycosyl transferase n=1 Tax=Glycomyces sp. NPDC048151 TaxID=3364002 RepID=UPI00370FC48C
MSTQQHAGEIGPGVLSRFTAAVYRHLVLGVFLAVAGAPTLLAWMLLAPDPGNAVWFVAALLPAAPALSAALYAHRAWAKEPDLSPARPLFRGLRMNLRDTLAWWVPVLALATVLAVNVLFAGQVAGGAVLRPVCLVLLVVLAVYSGHLLTVSSFFSFRFRDVLRVAAAEFFLSWKSSLGVLLLLAVAVGTVLMSSEAVLLLLAWAFAAMLWLVVRPVVADITKRFTAES